MRETLWTERSHYTAGRAQKPLDLAVVPQGESPSPRNHGFTVRVELPAGALESDALADYEAALADLILANWVEPEPATEQMPCYFTIRQPPAPLELQVDDTCPIDETTRRSIEDAFALANPQPQPPEELWALGDAMRVVLEPSGRVPVSGSD